MDFLYSIGDTNIRVFLVPALTSFLAVGLIRILFDTWSSTALATMAIGSGFIVAYHSITIFPLWPPAGTLGLLPYIVASGILIGALLDIINANDRFKNLCLLGMSIISVLWVVREWGAGTLTTTGIGLYGGLIFGGYWAMQQLETMRDEKLAAPVSVLSASTMLAIIAGLYGTSTGLYAIALSSATLGFMVWNWPKVKHMWGMTGTLTTGGVYLIVLSDLAFQNPAMALSVACSLMCFGVYSISSRLFPVPGPFAPIVQISLSIFPAALGIYLMP